jgi:glycosyltransferase involved in cell wall biosynthesis
MARILIVTAVFPPEPIVSAKLSFDIASELAKEHDVTVIAPRPSRPHGFAFGTLDTSTYQFKLVYLDSYVHSASSLFGRMKESRSIGKHTLKFIQESKETFDLIYMNTWPLLGQYYTVKAAFTHKIPSIIHIQDVYPESLSNKLPVIGKLVQWMLMPIDKYNLKKATKVLTISDDMKAYLIKTRKISEDKVSSVLNWQNESSFTDYHESAKHTQKGGKRSFMYLGNIGPVAGVDLLINAFEKAKIENCELIIAGSGSKKEELQKTVEQRKLGDSIRFQDVPDGMVPEIQSQADVMLLPIKSGAASSSIPSKLPAYMFSKKPVIASVDDDSETARVIKTSDCGWILTPENEDELAESMKKVISYEPQLLEEKGERGFHYAMENLSKKNNLKRIIQLIHNTL